MNQSVPLPRCSGDLETWSLLCVVGQRPQTAEVTIPEGFTKVQARERVEVRSAGHFGIRRGPVQDGN